MAASYDELVKIIEEKNEHIYKLQSIINSLKLEYEVQIGVLGNDLSEANDTIKELQDKIDLVKHELNSWLRNKA